MKSIILIRQNRSTLLALLLMFFVRGSFADQNSVPTGSKEPTIQIGDHILVNKIAYDLKLPFSEIVLLSLQDPKRGEVVVFLHPETNMRLVKRLVAVPGDRVHIEDGFVTINGHGSPGDLWGYRQRMIAGTKDFTYADKIEGRDFLVKRSPGGSSLEI